jgi:hypothetical protein
MVSRVVLAQQSAARISMQRSTGSVSALQPAVHQKALRPVIAAVPFNFREVRQFASGEQQCSQLTPGIAPAPLPWPIQAKLEVGAVNDPLEREADQVADQIMRMPDPASITFTANGEMVQRKCQSCADEQEATQTVRRKCQSCSGEEVRARCFCC